MSKSKFVCAVGSAGLSVVGLLVAGAAGAVVALAARHYGWASPRCLHTPAVVSLLVLAPVALTTVYRVFFKECYEPNGVNSHLRRV